MSFEIQCRHAGISLSVLFSSVQENAIFPIKLRTGSIVGMDLLFFFSLNFRIFWSSTSSLESISKEFLFGVALTK